jgi:hypothetical protein
VHLELPGEQRGIMNGLLNDLSGLLISLITLIVTLAIGPFLLKVLVPPVGEPIWRGYWHLVRWALIAPFRLVAWAIARASRRDR